MLICRSFFFAYKHQILSTILYESCPCMMCGESRVGGTSFVGDSNE